MAAQRTGQQAPGLRSVDPRVAAVAERVSRVWRRRSSGAAFETAVAEVDGDRRFEALEARIEHLETALEGLQDARYRHEVSDKESIGELRRRTDPEQMARDLSDDARRRGL
jgi:tRNA nucleotidyltransferase/poly(A) polymerase